MIQVPASAEIALEILSPECFYLSAHQLIFRAIKEIVKSGRLPDILSIVDHLTREKSIEDAGGVISITRLTNNVVSDVYLENHCRIVLEKFLAREVIRIGNEMVHNALQQEEDIFQLLDEVESEVMAVSLNHMRQDYSHISAAVTNVATKLEEVRKLDISLTGVPSGYKKLDNCTHGWQETDLIILAARPSVGKTAFALNLARNAAFDPYKPTPVGFFSLEMSKEQLVERMVSAESEIFLERLKKGKVDDDTMAVLYKEGFDKMHNAPIFIDDTSSLNIFELRAKARRMKRKHKVGMIIIDYLQLMSGDRANRNNGNREQEISKITRDLKRLAKDLKIPIIALSQLSREVEKRSDRTPQLSDLRESGAIEQDADLVAFLYRPTKKDCEQDPALKGTGYLTIAKHRNGSLDEFFFKVRLEIQKWIEIDEDLQAEGNWKPVPTEEKPKFQFPVKNFYETNNEEPEDLPF